MVWRRPSWHNVVPACESTQLWTEAQLYSHLAQLLPCVITGLATLDMCGVPPQVVPSSLRDLVYKPYVRFPVRVSWSWTLWIHLLETLVLCACQQDHQRWRCEPSMMTLETMIHAEIQSEDEITVNDRATADHVRGCRIAHGCTHLISSWKTIRLDVELGEPSATSTLNLYGFVLPSSLLAAG